MTGAGLLTAQAVLRAVVRPRCPERYFARAVKGPSGRAGGPERRGKNHAVARSGGIDSIGGAINVGGEVLSALTLRERARRFAYLPQGHIVHWPLPARDIVALGRYPHGATDPARLTPKDAEAVTRAMQAADVADLGERPVTEFSGGERSRVALARVFAVEAPVILADEPTVVT